jgi:hypothetical protein
MSQETAQEANDPTKLLSVLEPLSVLGFVHVPFSFPQSNISTRTVRTQLQNPPSGATQATIAIQSFNVDYTDNSHFDFSRLQVGMDVQPVREASCTITLRDDKVNERRWEGQAVGLVTYYGPR